MTKHFIILSSSYSLGARIAIHYLIDKKSTVDSLTDKVRRIKEMCGETVSISTHFIEAEGEDWESVVKSDAFFEGIYCCDSINDFIELIKTDRLLTAIDVANYILCTIPCTHLKLEKLLYLCYAEYLCSTHKKLFKDQIYAFAYGPIIKTVFNKYKGQRWIAGSGKKAETRRLSAKSRILFACDGIEKLEIIDRVIENYKGHTAAELVSLTHTLGGPWDVTDKSTSYAEITDETILKHHCYEC
ncbi:MAG: DUF4065 domain-containing protein [Pseudobutyrivibrio sp.]|nr:DUF4065 domain-containing protein [Pseudobutyrivibrio sp.]